MKKVKGSGGWEKKEEKRLEQRQSALSKEMMEVQEREA